MLFRSYKMFNYTKSLFKEKESKESFRILYEKIEKYEDMTDKTEIEIGNYLNHINNTSLSLKGEKNVRALYKIVDEIESIGDSCYNLAKILIRKNELCTNFTPAINNNIDAMLNKTDEAISHMISVLSKNNISKIDLNNAYNKEDEINNYRNQLKHNNIEDVNKEEYNYITGIIYMDIVSECEKIGDFVINVLEALKEKRGVEV